MVVPANVVVAANHGDLAVVEAWLKNAGPDAVNDVNDRGYTCLLRTVIQCQKAIAGVREHGSYKRYIRAPHRQFLRLRSLLVRRREERTNRLLLERLRTEPGPHYWSCLGSVPVWKSAELHLLQRMARLPDGPCWKVLSYWREAE